LFSKKLIAYDYIDLFEAHDTRIFLYLYNGNIDATIDALQMQLFAQMSVATKRAQPAAPLLIAEC
jgi:hypothetical protein